MTFSSLDVICRSVLLKRSLHWYVDAILAARDCLRELTIDDLRVINVKLLPVDEFNAVTIPSGTLDVIGVEILSGQMTRPLVPSDRINSLNSFDTDFNIQRYDEATASDTPTPIYGNINGTFQDTAHSNQYGENIGRFFGNGDGDSDTYKVIPERNQIQLNEALDVDSVIVKTISDGQDADAATHVHLYAVKTIEEYVKWQIGLGDELHYINARLILRARMNDLDTVSLKKIIQKHTRQSIK